MAAAAADANAPVTISAEQGDTVLTYADGSVQVSKGETPVQWLERQCLLFGSSLEGRTASYRYLTGTLQKSAVLVSERSGLLYFPLLSMKDPECIWISFHPVLSCRSISAHETEILFDSGLRCTVPVNRRIIRGQMKRCEIFMEQLHNRCMFPKTKESADA